MNSKLAVLMLILCGSADCAQAFHDQGVAACNGCHILHDSQDGVQVAFGSGGEALLREPSATDLCLSCHGESLGGVMGLSPTAPLPERGPGNFIFLLEDNLSDSTIGPPQPIPGERAGHSIISMTYGLQPDALHTTSPGGSYSSHDLGCTSCHDPHGNGNYLMLYGAQQVTGDGFAFSYDAPQAEGLPAGEYQETQLAHVAYQAGWSDWCANCHGFYHDEGGNIFEHPVAGTLSGVEAATYNQYDGDANPSGGLYATAYLTEVPLQDPSLTSTSTGGATSSSQISCMTCHRAHATSAPYALRWDPNVLALGDDGVVSGSWPIPNPYFASSQRSLCVKCHEPQTRQHHDNRPCLACHRNRVGGTVSDPLPDVFGQ